MLRGCSVNSIKTRQVYVDLQFNYTNDSARIRLLARSETSLNVPIRGTPTSEPVCSTFYASNFHKNTNSGKTTRFERNSRFSQFRPAVDFIPIFRPASNIRRKLLRERRREKGREWVKSRSEAVLKRQKNSLFALIKRETNNKHRLT